MMIKKSFPIFSLLLLMMPLAACGGLRFSQSAPEAKDFHPQTIVIFPVEIGGNNEEARGSVEQIMPGVLSEKKWFNDIIDTKSLRRQLSANKELNDAMTNYVSKLRALNFSDPDLSKKIGEIIKADAFLLVSVDIWNYTVEKEDKFAKVSLAMKLYDASTGREMWKARHQIDDEYIVMKPELAKVARNVARAMIDYMPH